MVVRVITHATEASCSDARLRQLLTITHVNAQMRKKIKPVVLPPLKRRSAAALNAKMRNSAGPMQDKSWHASCRICSDCGTIAINGRITACPECAAND